MRRFASTWLIISLLLTVARSQVQPKLLSNVDVIQMVSLGLADDGITERIRAASTTNFDTSIDGLKELKAAKVSDTVLRAMINSPASSSGTNLRKTGGQGNGAAENNVGWMYDHGLVVAQDYQQALVWYRESVDRYKNPSAETNIGWMYEYGLGVPQDYKEAATWYRKAADQGSAEGQYDLGGMYKHGRGVPQDYQQALIWFRKAADQGGADARNALGMLCKDGLGVPQDDREAVDWFRKAADQGYATAQFNLGWMYENGLGVPQDHPQALLWFRKAAAQGSAEAQGLLDEIPSAGSDRAGQSVSTSNRQSEAAPALSPSAASTVGQDAPTHAVGTPAGMRGDESTTGAAEQAPASSGSGEDVEKLMKKYPDFTTVFVVEVSNRALKPDGGGLCMMKVRTDERAYLVEQETYAGQALFFHGCTLLEAGVTHPGRIKGGSVELLYNAGKGKIKVARYAITGTAQ